MTGSLLIRQFGRSSNGAVIAFLLSTTLYNFDNGKPHFKRNCRKIFNTMLPASPKTTKSNFSLRISAIYQRKHNALFDFDAMMEVWAEAEKEKNDDPEIHRCR